MKRGRTVLLLTVTAVVVVVGTLRRSAADVVLRTVPVGSAPLPLTVAGHIGRIFVGNQGNDTVSVLDAATGHAVATTPIGGTPWSFVMDERRGRLFTTDLGGNVNILNVRSGALISSVAVGSTPSPRTTVGTLVVDNTTGRAFVSSYDSFGGQGQVSVLDERSGRVLHTTTVGRSPCALAIVARTRRLFVANCQDNTVVVLAVPSGRLVATAHIGASPDGVAVDEAMRRVFVVVYGDAHTGYRSHVAVLDARTGHVVRVVPVGRYARPPVIDPQRHHVFISDDQGLVMLDAHSGHLLHRALLGGAALGEAVLAERAGRIVLTEKNAGNITTSGRLSILDARTGALLHTLPLGIGIGTFAVDERGERIYVPLSGPISTLPGGAPGNPMGLGTVAVVDLHTGALLRTVTVGLMPSTVVLDAHEHHALVLNVGCPAPGFPCGVGGTDPWAWLPGWLRHWLPWRSHRARPATNGSITVLDSAP